MSKTYAMAGWRIGFAVETIAALLNKFILIMVLLHQFKLQQHALNGPQDC